MSSTKQAVDYYGVFFQTFYSSKAVIEHNWCGYCWGSLFRSIVVRSNLSQSDPLREEEEETEG